MPDAVKNTPTQKPKFISKSCHGEFIAYKRWYVQEYFMKVHKKLKLIWKLITIEICQYQSFVLFDFFFRDHRFAQKDLCFIVLIRVLNFLSFCKHFPLVQELLKFIKSGPKLELGKVTLSHWLIFKTLFSFSARQEMAEKSMPNW